MGSLIPPYVGLLPPAPEGRFRRLLRLFMLFLRSQFSAISFVFQLLWLWPVVGFGAAILYGYGVNAMYGNDFITAVVCHSLAIAWLAAKTLTWELIAGHASRRRVSFLILLMAGALLWGSLSMVEHRHSFQFPPSSVINPTSPPTAIPPKASKPETGPVAHQGVPQVPPKSNKSQPPLKPTQPLNEVHPYDLSGPREERFLSLLEKPQSGPRDVLRIGCVAWSEHSCLAAGKFLLEFSKAGWTIDSDRVFSMDPEIPTDGVTICTNWVPPPPKLPPHLGRWQKMDTSQVKVFCALMEIGISVNGASDTSLPTGTLGVYFGPEPSSQINIDENLRKACESPPTAAGSATSAR
jgi:hypothetical protein